MNKYLKKLAASLPKGIQHELRRVQSALLIRRGRFNTPDPEWHSLDSMISHGDWVIDVGANVGHYTQRMSDLVGPSGRVIAVEPVPETFALLAANVNLFKNRNVTLLNVAASDRIALYGMKVPTLETGLPNLYEASLTKVGEEFRVLTVDLGGLQWPEPIRLVKVDAEGHDALVLRGLETILRKDRPLLIVENRSADLANWLKDFGYWSTRFGSSPNEVFRYSNGLVQESVRAGSE